MTSSQGNTYHHAEEVDSGQFSFTAVEGGEYSACFAAHDHKPDVTLSIDLEWGSGVHCKSLGSLAKKSKVEVSFFFNIVLVIIITHQILDVLLCCCVCNQRLWSLK